jgi:glucosamine--fructose-6-phosphate aminotransferase (isomerizing)
VIAEEGDDDGRAVRRRGDPDPASPTLLQPLLSTVPAAGVRLRDGQPRGHDVDQPRNLAKSVTVE